jgi:DNA-binding transcriptional LysR family regulator
MELDQIRTFMAVARRRSFSQAAEDLLRTQPAVSIKIRALEAEIGQQLLERRRRGVELTPAGAIFFRRAESILGEIEGLRNELSDLSSLRVGRVSLGASDTVSLYLLPPALKRFVATYPGVDLRLSTQISRRVLELVSRDEIDIGIVTLPVADPSVETRALYRDEFVAVVPPSHPLARLRRLRPEDLRGHPIIHLKAETLTRAWINARLEPYGLHEQIRLEVSTVEVIKRLVEAGLGISILPEIAVQQEAASGRLLVRRLPSLELLRPVGWVWRRGRYFSRALTALVEEVEKTIRQSYPPRLRE